MKKLKVMAAALLASALPLSGCDVLGFKIPGSDVVMDLVDKIDILDIIPNNKPGNDNNNDNNDEEQDPPVVDLGVTSVTVSGPTEVMAGNQGQFSATVQTSKDVAKTVSWKVSNTSLATIDSFGKLTAKAAGTVTVTATSTVDNKKFGSLTVTIKNGFDDTLIGDGYTFSATFPVSAIRNFLGNSSVAVPSLTNLVGGCYYCVYEASSQGAAYIEVVVDGVRDKEYAEAMFATGTEKVYQTYSGYEAVDKTNLYTVAIAADFDEETYDSIAPTYLDFYKSSDVWADGTLTTDTAWDATKVADDMEDYADLISEFLSVTPFIKMGEEYEINYVDNSFMRALAEMAGADPDDYPDQFYICDYTILDSILSGYGTILIQNDFEEKTDEYGKYHVKNAGIEDIIIYTGWTEGGNTIFVEKNPAVLKAWPTAFVDDFVENVIGSKYELPAYDKTKDALFMMQIEEEQVSETETETTAIIQTSEVALTELQAYVSDLVAAGFESEFTAGTDETYPSWYITKGKIAVEIYFKETYNESTKTYDANNGSLMIYIYGDSTRHEEQGVYLPETMTAVLANGAFTLTPEIVDIDSPTFTVTSSEVGVATVNGLEVTPVAEGTTTITITVNGTEFTASTTLTVITKSLFMQEVDAANEYFEGLGAEELLVLPDIIATDVMGSEGKTEGSYQIGLETTVTSDDYAELLEAAGFTMSEDEYGYPVATKGDYRVEPWDYEGMLVIDIFYEVGGGQEEGGGATFDFSELTTTSGSMNGISFATAKQGGQNDPAYNSNSHQLRLYANNTMTISSSGAPITSIDIECTFDKNGSLTPSTGTLENVDGGYHWEGNASSITFTMSSSGQVRITKMTINGGGSGTGGGGSMEVPTISDTILNAAKSMYASVFGQQPSSICNYDDEEAEGDFYVCKNGSLEFAGFASYDDLSDEVTVAGVYEELVSDLPSGAIIYSSYEYEIDEEQGYYDVWFQVNGLIYAIYAVDYYGLGYFVSYSVDVFETSQASAYINYAYSAE